MDPDAALSIPSLEKAAPTRLAGLFRISTDRRHDWEPDDLAAMYRHLLAAPV